MNFRKAAKQAARLGASREALRGGEIRLVHPTFGPSPVISVSRKDCSRAILVWLKRLRAHIRKEATK